jgi:dihydrolipoamide dehydrogenase
MATSFDLLVIGAGAGNRIALAVAKLGLTVGYIEKERMGGTCLNTGCIPTKILGHISDVVEGITTAHRYGITVDTTLSVDWEGVMKHVWGFVDHEEQHIREEVTKHPNITFISGEASFVSDHVVSVNGTEYTSEKIIIVTGAKPVVPPIPGLSATPYLTSSEALHLKAQPKSMIIIGGGYIGCEFAHFFGALGTQVTIVERFDRLMMLEDEELGRAFTQYFGSLYHLEFEKNIKEVRHVDGHFEVVIAPLSGGEDQVLVAEQLLVATGRGPVTDRLHLENTGIKTDPRGFIQVNDFLETTVPGVWAYGDTTGRYQFRHTANHEADTIFRNEFLHCAKEPMQYHAVPHAAFTAMQVGAVGKTEDELKKAGVDYVVGKSRYIHSGMGVALRVEEGFVKILADRHTKKILGAHIFGYDASILIHELTYAITHGGTTDDLLRTIHVHPSLSELLPKAVETMDFSGQGMLGVGELL